MVKLRPKSSVDVPESDQCNELARDIMSLVRQSGIYTSKDIAIWKKVVEEDRRAENLKGLTGMYDAVDRAVSAVKEMKGNYYSKINSALSRGIFSQKDAEFSKQVFASVDMGLREKMLKTIDKHISTSERLLNEFEQSLIKDLLTVSEVRSFSEKFRNASYEDREEILIGLVNKVDGRNNQLESWEVVRILVESSSNILDSEWLQANIQRLSSFKNIPAFKKILDVLRSKLSSTKRENISGSSINSSNASDEISDDLHSDVLKESSDNNNVSSRKSDTKNKIKVIAEAIVAIDANNANVATDSAMEVATNADNATDTEIEVQTDPSTVTESAMEVATQSDIKFSDAEISNMQDENPKADEIQMGTNNVSEFQARINRAFKNDPDIAPTGLQMLGSDKDNTGKFMEVVSEVRDGSVRQVQTVIHKLRNSSVNLSIFSVEIEEEELTKAA